MNVLQTCLKYKHFDLAVNSYVSYLVMQISCKLTSFYVRGLPHFKHTLLHTRGVKILQINNSIWLLILRSRFHSIFHLNFVSFSHIFLDFLKKHIKGFLPWQRSFTFSNSYFKCDITAPFFRIYHTEATHFI